MKKSMLLNKETHQLQTKLANYCRTGEMPKIEGARPERLPQYRRLVFNILKNTMKQAYPITFKFLSEKQWIDLLNDYYTNHDCKENRIWKMPYELYEFVVAANYDEKYQIPFLSDLLLFEWIEIEVHTMEDEEADKFTVIQDIWNDNLVMNPEFRLLHLEYPVHSKKVNDIQESDKGNYYLLAYREKDTFQVRFMSLSVLYAYMIEQLQEEKALETIATEATQIFGVKNVALLKGKMQDFTDKLLDRKFLLGKKI